MWHAAFQQADFDGLSVIQSLLRGLYVDRHHFYHEHAIADLEASYPIHSTIWVTA